MKDLPFWKAILITFGVIALASVYMYVGSLLGLTEPWIAFAAVTVWGAAGMKMEDAPGIFIGSALGLLITLAMEVLPDLYGDWAVIIPVAAIVLAISCKIKNWLPLFCNFGLFIFLTIGSADIFQGQHLQLQYLQDLAFGALCFWIIPWLVIKIRSRGQEHAKADQAP